MCFSKRNGYFCTVSFSIGNWITFNLSFYFTQFVKKRTHEYYFHKKRGDCAVIVLYYI